MGNKPSQQRYNKRPSGRFEEQVYGSPNQRKQKGIGYNNQNGYLATYNAPTALANGIGHKSAHSASNGALVSDGFYKSQ